MNFQLGTLIGRPAGTQLFVNFDSLIHFAFIDKCGSRAAGFQLTWIHTVYQKKFGFGRTRDKIFHTMGLGARQSVFGGLKTTKAQTSLCYSLIEKYHI